MNWISLFVSFFPLNRIPVVAARVWIMEPVKLDSPVKVFVVFVALEQLEQPAAMVMYICTFCMSILLMKDKKSLIPGDATTVCGEEKKSNRRTKKRRRKLTEKKLRQSLTRDQIQTALWTWWILFPDKTERNLEYYFAQSAASWLKVDLDRAWTRSLHKENFILQYFCDFPAVIFC